MNKVLICIFTFLLVTPVMAQESLVGSSPEKSGYAAAVVDATTLSNNPGIIAGLRGGVIMDNKLALGGGLYGLGGASIKSNGTSDTGDTLYHQLTYGGLEIEYFFERVDTIHYSVVSLFGVGRAALHNSTTGASSDDSTIFVFEPGFNALVDLTDHFQFDLGLHYRLVSGADTKNLHNNDLDGLALVFAIKFSGI